MIKGTINFPGDKSISHRVLILASISKGNSTIYNLSQSKDVQRTMSILKNCGIQIIRNTDRSITVYGSRTLQSKNKKFRKKFFIFQKCP